MSQRRSNMEIVADILKIAKKGVRKTRIVYGANLNFKMLQEYLERLEKAGLVIRNFEKKGMIRTTSKGRNYLQNFRELKLFGLQ